MTEWRNGRGRKNFFSEKIDFALIESRCRLKAEGLRWAAARRRLMTDGADFPVEVRPFDADIIRRAKGLDDCYLWMCRPSSPCPSDFGVYEEAARCFESLASAVALVRLILGETEMGEGVFGGALHVLAEAQSAVRVSVAKFGGVSDNDQQEVFDWLRTTAGERRIFLERFMKSDDPADPSQAEEATKRIESMKVAFEKRLLEGRLRKKLLGKIRYEASQIARNSGDRSEHWQTLSAATDELVSNGMPPSSPEFRELLVPIIDRLPDLAGVPRRFQLVLREIDRFMASRSCPGGLTITQSNGQPQRLANLLKGRSMVLIGGHRSPEAIKALKDAFGLLELFWVETKEHESYKRFEPFVARSEVAVILLAVRWASHSFAEVGEFCVRYGKPLVRLPGGYNPNQVAAQIMSQCSSRLAS